LVVLAGVEEDNDGRGNGKTDGERGTKRERGTGNELTFFRRILLVCVSLGIVAAVVFALYCYSRNTSGFWGGMGGADAAKFRWEQKNRK